MGLFDTIIDKLYCPFCGKLQENNQFQTKDLGQNMQLWKISDIIKLNTRMRKDDTNIYHECRDCKKWIEIVIRGELKEYNLLEESESK